VNEKMEADEVLRLAVAVAAREIKRLSDQERLVGWESADLERYAGIVQRANDHELKWMSKLDPSKLPDELVRRVLAATEEGEADGARAKRKPRAGA
jgi:5,10-methylenetetrahydrofolate reductase